ncbi:hypothetical protein GSY71_06870 [Pusillimonas sp. TS35]|uniref:hypothetical protein n=1 Tax=Paracandidimonas lactea TaxID=2895524 RepID=UPI0013689FF8|nr:hypothetical protein [Paracandidimonas lactea]MYN12865.1 hypothetical protein [Pusillimonas sp. TS35]
MKAFRTTLTALILSGLAGGSWAQSTEEHSAHHPGNTADVPTKSGESVATAPAEQAQLLGKMDTQLKAIQDFHERFQKANPEERQKLFSEHRKLMQESMDMMSSASSSSQGMGMMQGMGMGMMQGMGSMEKTSPSAPSDKQPPGGAGSRDMMMGQSGMQNMMQHHDMMLKRMDMMQGMMQLMMDRLSATEGQ